MSCCIASFDSPIVDVIGIPESEVVLTMLEIIGREFTLCPDGAAGFN